jgi:hypothetical protein
LLILGGEEGGLMMVEPPGDFWRGRVFEVDDRILVAAELSLVKQRAGTMDEAAVLVAGTWGDALAMKAREQRRGTGSVKAFVVVEDPNPQEQHSLDRTLNRKKNEQPELLSIKGWARCVKVATQFRSPSGSGRGCSFMNETFQFRTERRCQPVRHS